MLRQPAEAVVRERPQVDLADAGAFLPPYRFGERQTSLVRAPLVDEQSPFQPCREHARVEQVLFSEPVDVCDH
ncbi:hypothetical protein LO763_22640 [Glycomyces sp. A-F 0318]|uniref:hypothetical protein n=1 Tax=Glycomyces amatae TaxID=2881355 RepID=UPI001E3ABD63|nr:hypothetical protein [Glycomyces amatae]MCD0446418.1 hypothetical protein [Glycomyces amatae]